MPAVGHQPAAQPLAGVRRSPSMVSHAPTAAVPLPPNGEMPMTTVRSPHALASPMPANQPHQP